MYTIGYIKKLVTKYNIILAAVFISGFALGFFEPLFNLKKITTVQNISPFREKENNYAFINPLLFYDVPKVNDSSEYSGLVYRIGRIVSDFTNENSERKASFYYRDLSHGQWVGINEDESYTPSSLLKVVVMIAYFKEAESRPNIFSHTILFSKDIDKTIGTISYDRGTNLKLNQRYTVSELIDKMIIDSDNGATYTLLSEMDESSLGQIYVDLNLKDPENTGRSYTIKIPEPKKPAYRLSQEYCVNNNQNHCHRISPYYPLKP